MELLLVITDKKAPGQVQAIVGLLFILFLILTLVQGVSSTKYQLGPRDEYELHQDTIAKAKAFNFLSTGVFFVIILFPKTWVLPLLYILLGFSWLKSVQENDSGNETTK